MVTWGGVTTFDGTTTTNTPVSSASNPAGGFSFGNNPASTPTSTGFGTPTTTPLTPTTPNFGTSTAGSTPGKLLNFSSKPETPSTPLTNNLFGTPGTPAIGTPASSVGGLFGRAAASPAISLFGGSTPVRTNPAPSNLFSPAPAATASSTPALQNQQQQQQHAALYAQYEAHARHESQRIENALLALRSAYDPSSPGGRFSHVFYDPLPSNHPSLLLQCPHCPPGMDPTKWLLASTTDNPDPERFSPVCLVGAQALSDRLAQQQKKATLLKGYTTQLKGALEASNEGRRKSYQTQDNFRATIAGWEKRMLSIVRKVEIIRGLNVPLQRDELILNKQIDELNNNIQKFRAVLRKLELDATAYGSSLNLRSRTNADPNNLLLSEEEKSGLFRVLQQQNQGMEALANVVKRDLRDLAIAKKEVKELEQKIAPIYY